MGSYLRYRSQAVQDGELDFLSEEEREAFGREGSLASGSFSPESKILFDKWQEQSLAQINLQIAHTNTWRTDINHVLDQFEELANHDRTILVPSAFEEGHGTADGRNYFVGALPVQKQRLRNKDEWVARSILFLQCALLQKLEVVPQESSAQYSWQLTEEAFVEQGIDLDWLYPLISRERHLFLLDSLAYNFGYGPNLFPWKSKRLKKGDLEATPGILYLVSINVGKLTGGKDCLMWKVGITTKEGVVGEGGSRHRYSGKYVAFVDVLREMRYESAEHAFIKEQVYLDLVRKEKTRSLENKYSHRKLTDGDLGVLGASEWVLEGRSKDLAIQYFDQLTRMD